MTMMEAMKKLIHDSEYTQIDSTVSSDDLEKVMKRIVDLEKSASTIAKLESKIEALETQIEDVQSSKPTASLHPNLQKSFERILYAMRFFVLPEHKQAIAEAAKMIDYQFR
jgi:hypothetical protein